MVQNKAELTAHLSHEFRNALACIHQFGNILVDGLAGELSAEQREYIGIMVDNATKIRKVLDGALETVAAEGTEDDANQNKSATEKEN
jgi:two-component system sensor histidine kinase GlrK